jgi:hypothetical protein
MSTRSQFDKYFAKDKNYLGCIFEQFILKFDLKPNDFIILNTGEQETGGTHWVVLYDKAGQLYYFDSFGVIPTEWVLQYEISKKTNVIYGNYQYQPIESDRCGQWVTAFVLFMKKNDFEDFEKVFSLGDVERMN